MTKRICVAGASGRAWRVTNILGPEDCQQFPDYAALGFAPQHSWRDHVDPRSPRP
jgi:hypothetical protein